MALGTYCTHPLGRYHFCICIMWGNCDKRLNNFSNYYLYMSDFLNRPWGLQQVKDSYSYSLRFSLSSTQIKGLWKGCGCHLGPDCMEVRYMYIFQLTVTSPVSNSNLRSTCICYIRKFDQLDGRNPCQQLYNHVSSPSGVGYFRSPTGRARRSVNLWDSRLDTITVAFF